LPYQIESTRHFNRKYKKLTDKNPTLIKRIDKALSKLLENPLDKSLKTHRINTKHGHSMSSYVTSDIRIIWQLEDLENILLLDIGGHEGSKGVY
jgi:mRNA-degrading endonuclease YafQ of YafQ-DinJ toxin-antitoxin module